MKQWETGDPVAYDGASDGRISPSEVNAEAYLDPYALLQARRDETGAVTDLIYTEANRSACEDLELPYEMLIGSGLLDIKPGARDVGLFDMLVNVVETGEQRRPGGDWARLTIKPGPHRNRNSLPVAFLWPVAPELSQII